MKSIILPQEDVSTMQSHHINHLNPHHHMTTSETDYDSTNRWTTSVPQLKEVNNSSMVQQQQQQQNHIVPSDVISMQYMELEEFLLENSDQDGKVFLDHSPLNEKHYHVSLEQRGLDSNNHTNFLPVIPNDNNTPTPSELLPGGDNTNVHLLSIHHPHLHQQVTNHHGDPNSPPQSSCDSPPSLQQFHHSPHHANNSQQDRLSNSTARKSLPRRVSTSSNNSSSFVVTPPHTPQHPSPPNSADIIMSPNNNNNNTKSVKTKRGVKRSRKETVPDDNKDDKYWRRRAKNNAAAKRSRDLRREKENHIMQRVAFLEKENRILHQEMDSIKAENDELKERLSQYEIKQL